MVIVVRIGMLHLCALFCTCAYVVADVSLRVFEFLSLNRYLLGVLTILIMQLNRLVGDVLVERTVEEVRPSVTQNKENVSLIWYDSIGPSSNSFIQV